MYVKFSTNYVRIIIVLIIITINTIKKYIIDIHHLQYVIIILQIITATIIIKKIARRRNYEAFTFTTPTTLKKLKRSPEVLAF